MKEATGELNMTVITVVAIAAVAGLFYAFVWPMIQRSIVQNTCKAMGEGWTAERGQTANSKCVNANSDEAGGDEWYCCPPNSQTN